MCVVVVVVSVWGEGQRRVCVCVDAVVSSGFGLSLLSGGGEARW